MQLRKEYIACFVEEKDGMKVETKVIKVNKLSLEIRIDKIDIKETIQTLSPSVKVNAKKPENTQEKDTISKI
jgi:hypothetical protein